MTLDTLINEMNDAAERTSDQVFLWRDGLPQDLANHLNSLADAELLPAIQRLTAECEKRRLQAMNHLLSREKAFSDAMFRMHQWRMVNAPTPDGSSASDDDNFLGSDEIGRVTLHEDEAARNVIVGAAVVEEGGPGNPTRVPTLFLGLDVWQNDDSAELVLVGTNEEQAKQLRDLLDQAIRKLWP